MRREIAAGGFTLLEVVIAMAITLIAAVGMFGIFETSLRLNGDARHMLRATAIAQDLLNNMATWPYQDATGAPLENTSTANDADLADTALKFQTSADPVGEGVADHGEETIAGLASWTGIPASSLGEYQRYWSVAYTDPNGDGINDSVQIAVIVRWPHGWGYRRVVLIWGMLNPQRQ
jgi:prepilin-type N-terminal cleavage/methylation domain-containing protein